MPVIGTAGHVDHGKSTLVEALTGRDPDRLAEEKRRGLTIDLGFAWTDLGGVEVGFVDVPGHERFIKNMLAGIEAVQAALFVVAADEGWMPQSEEHLAVLDLLEIRYGVVALTRIDMVDDEMMELATAEVADRLAGTTLEPAPIVPVSAPTGVGIEQLRNALAEAVQAAPPAIDRTRPRLWIDRSFVIAGAGTVVTGTLTGGSLAVGETVAVWPGPLEARIRGLQSHERAITKARPGERTAVNLTGLDAGEVTRGAMLGRTDQWLPTRELLAAVRAVRSLGQPLADRGAYHVHLGSGAWPARLRLVDEETALIRLSARVPLAMGDRFILREVGRRAVVGGGRVLDPAPARSGRAAAKTAAALRAVLDRDADEGADALLAARGSAELSALKAHSGGGTPSVGLVADGRAIAPIEADRLLERAATEVASYHEANPLRPGIPRASLAGSLGISIGQLEALLSAEDRLEGEGSTVRLATFGGGYNAEQEQAWVEAQGLLGESLAVPRASQLGLDLELLHALERDGRLVRIADDLVYLPAQIAQIEAGLGELGDDFTVAAFRDAFGMTRRHAVPLLEWLDRRGVTERRGDVRRLRRKKAGGPGAGAAPPR